MRRQNTKSACLLGCLLFAVSLVFAQGTSASVAGSNRGYAKRTQKKGLILTPYKFEFTDDDGDVFGPLLSAHRNYSKGMVQFSNPTVNDQNVLIDQYRNWQDFDVIYVSTHGLNVNGCYLSAGVQVKDSMDLGDYKIKMDKEKYCRTTLNSGIHYTTFGDKKKWYNLHGNDDGVLIGNRAVYLTDQFFEATYTSQSLQNKIIIIDACQVGQFGEIPAAFAGLLQNGHVLYWTNTVFANDSKAACDYLFKRMLDDGVTLTRAYDEMPAKLKTGLKSDVVSFELADTVFQIDVKDEVALKTDLRLLTVGKPQHLVEPVTLLQYKDLLPIKEREVLTTFKGSFGDGKPDKMDIAFELKGYTANEIEKEQMSISLSVNGKAVMQKLKPLPDKDPNDNIDISPGKSPYITRVKISDIDLQQDLKEGQQVTLDAYFHFTEADDGYQQLIVQTPGMDMRIVMQGEDGEVVMLYDDDIQALKMTVVAEGETLYADKQGFVYQKPEDEGWIKVNWNSMMAFGKAMFPMGSLDLAGESPAPTDLHRIAGFAKDITIARLEREPGAVRTSTKDAARTSFLYQNSTKIQFDEQQRLVELSNPQATIRYYYEKQTIVLPNAREMTIPGMGDMMQNLPPEMQQQIKKSIKQNN